MRKIRFLSLIPLLLLAFVSCKEDNAAIDNGKKQLKPDVYNGPMVNLGVNIKSSYGKDARFFKIDFKEGTRDPKLLQLNWKKGEEFTVLGCIRRKYAPANWHRNIDFVTAKLKGVVTENSNGAMKMQITGNFAIPEDWIQEGHFKDPAMYFGAYYVQKGGQTLAGMDINSNEESVTVNPSGFIGIQNGYAKTAPAFNVLVGIPLTRIMLAETTNSGARQYDFKKVEDPTGETVALPDDTQPTIPAQNQTYISKPAGSLIHIRLKNEFAFPVRFPLSAKLRTQSFLGFNKSVPYDFWTYVDDRQKAIGTSAYNYHFGGNPFSQNDTEDNSIAYYLRDVSPTEDNKSGEDVVLQPGDFVDLYSMAPVNRNWHGTPALTIDFSNLKIEIKNNNQTWVPLPDNNQTRYVVLEGADKATKETLNPLKFVSQKPDTKLFPDGQSRYLPFDLKSDLMISAVGYRWDDLVGDARGSLNRGVLQLSNINREPIDLSNYYLARMIYSGGSIYFKTAPSGQDANFARALLMPLLPGDDRSEILTGGTERSDYRVQNYSVSFMKRVSAINSNSVGLFFCDGFGKQDGTMTWQSLRNAYPSMVTDNPDHLNNSCATIVYEHNQYGEDLYPWNANAGIMKRGNGNLSSEQEALNGWALVKKVGSKYYIIDVFGTLSQDQYNGFKDNFGSNNSSPIEFLRLPDVFFPTADMDTKPNRVYDGTDESTLPNKQWRSYRYWDYQHGGKDENNTQNLSGVPDGIGSRYWK